MLKKHAIINYGITSKHYKNREKSVEKNSEFTMTATVCDQLCNSVTACHQSCSGGCTGDQPTDCANCKSGYNNDDLHGCTGEFTINNLLIYLFKTYLFH